jgi:multimeric flavodoxin WrbA
MFVLGLQGSPRLSGNTSRLLSSFLNETERLGAETYTLEAARKNITPCQNCGACEREGFCPIQDDMQEIYPLLRRADIIAMASPVFFYSVTASLKALIDRTQTLWSRRYVHNLSDPGRKWRRGFLLSVGATKGKSLFDGVVLTAKYFFDAVGATYEGSLTYKHIDKEGEISEHPTAMGDARAKAAELAGPLFRRKKVLFVCRENACLSQMASAFAQYQAGDKIEVTGAGNEPAERINPLMDEVMREEGIDMAFRRPRSLEEVTAHMRPELIISMGCREGWPVVPGAPREDWDLPDPSGESAALMRKVRDEIKERVLELIERLLGKESSTA